MGLFSSRVSNGRTTLVMNVGSGSVATAVITTTAATGHVLAQNRTATGDAEKSQDHLLLGVLQSAEQSLTDTIAQYKKNGGNVKHISSALTIFHAPWIHSHTSRATTALTTNTRITTSIINEIIHRAIAEPSPLTESQVFEQSVIRVELNGYATEKPDGKTARHVAAVVLRSDLQDEMKKGIEDLFARLLPGKVITLRSSTFVYMNVVRTCARDVPNYTFVDVTSEATGLFAVHHGIIEAFASIPVGTHTIVRSVSSDKNAPPEVARSMVRMLAQSTCTGEECRKVEASLVKTETDIVSDFGKGFSEIAAARKLPPTLILAAHPDVTEWMARFLTRIDFGQFTNTGRSFAILPLAECIRDTHVTLAQDIVPDTGITAAATFINSTGRQT